MGKDRWQKLKKKMQDENGQSMVEYGLIIVTIVVLGAGVLAGPMKDSVTAMYDAIKNKVAPALSGP